MEFVSPAQDLASEDLSQSETGTARLARVFAACCDGLYRYILVRVGSDAHAAEELIQEVCTVAAGKSVIPERDDELEAWLVGIARNLVRRHWRHRRRESLRTPLSPDEIAQIAEDLASHPIPPELLARRELKDILLRGITLLPAADQRLLLAFYFDGRSMQTIAAESGATEKSVESKLYRIRNRLREILGALHEDMT